jgi:hypothetical protein
MKTLNNKKKTAIATGEWGCILEKAKGAGSKENSKQTKPAGLGECKAHS